MSTVLWYTVVVIRVLLRGFFFCSVLFCFLFSVGILSSKSVICVAPFLSKAWLVRLVIDCHVTTSLLIFGRPTARACVPDPPHRLRRLLRGGDEQGPFSGEGSFPAHAYAGQRHGGVYLGHACICLSQNCLSSACWWWWWRLWCSRVDGDHPVP